MYARTFWIASAVAGACLLAMPAYAQTSIRVECPLETARRTITNPLPDGWWTTPLVSGLSGTRVQVVAGRRALVCRYGDSGSVLRNEPDGYSCTAVSGGFDCRSARSPSGSSYPGVYSDGRLEVPQTYQFDLDDGRVAPRGADLWFEAETSDRLYLTPQNGARIWVGDRSNRGFEGCIEGSYSAARVPLSALPAGSYVCMETSEERFAQFRVEGLSRGSPKTLVLSYTTWDW